MTQQAGECARVTPSDEPDAPPTGSARCTRMRFTTIAEVVLFVLFASVSAPVWWALASNAVHFHGQINDFPHYEPYVDYLRVWPPRSASPHFLYPLSVKVLAWPLGLRAGTTVVMAGVFGLTGVVLYRVARRTWDTRPALGPRVALAVPLTFLVAESPVLLLPAGRSEWFARAAIDPIGSGGGVFVLHVWGSPPSTLQLPVALLLVVALLDALHPDPEGKPRVGVAVLVGLTVATAIAKPAVLLVLLVAVPLYPLVARLPIVTVRWRTLVQGFLLPGAICVLAQSLFLGSGLSPLQQAGVTIEPFWLVAFAQLTRPVVWSGALLVLLCLAMGGRRYLSDPPIRLLVLALAVSCVPTFLLREVSERNPNDALAWTFVLTAQLLLVMSIRFAALEVRDAWVRRRGEGVSLPWWTPPAVLVSVLFLAAGVYHYLVLIGQVAYPVLPSMSG